MIVTAIMLVAGLALLVKGADLFVGGGSGLALRHSISPALIGSTIIAFGTSLPELVVSTDAAATGNTGIALGNVIGSNIANIALVLALCTLIRPGMVAASGTSRSALVRNTAMMLAATVVFALLAARGTLDALAGAVLLSLFAIVLVLLVREGREEGGVEIKSHGWADALYIGLGLVAVIIGAQLVVDGAVELAEAFGIPAFVIGVSVVAVGTSLPELATSIVAAIRTKVPSPSATSSGQHLQPPSGSRGKPPPRPGCRRVVGQHRRDRPLLGRDPPPALRPPLSRPGVVGPPARRLRRLHRLELRSGAGGVTERRKTSKILVVYANLIPKDVHLPP
jgi:cation:H+ antiporter